MKKGLVHCGLVLALACSLGAQSTPGPRTLEEFDALFMKISNWGRWGDDQRGAANLVTDAKRKQAASLVKIGLAMSIAHDVLTENAVDNQGAPTHKMNPLRGGVVTDSYQFGGHSGTTTHWDALCHIFYKGRSF